MISLTLLLSSNVFSQDDERKGFVAINLGPSIPTGNFGSKNFDNIEAGFATSGAVFDITFGYRFRPNIGFTAVWRGQANAIDVDAYAAGLANYLGSGYSAGSTYVSVETSAYTLGGILIGLYVSFPITKKLSFEPRTLIGVSSATLPAMTSIAYYYGSKMTTIKQDQSVSSAFSYIIGAGSKYFVSPKVCLLFDLDFFAANANWQNVGLTSFGHVTSTIETMSYNHQQKFSTFNMCAGIGVRF